jgi:hypothetical protein
VLKPLLARWMLIWMRYQSVRVADRVILSFLTLGAQVGILITITIIIIIISLSLYIYIYIYITCMILSFLTLGAQVGITILLILFLQCQFYGLLPLFVWAGEITSFFKFPLLPIAPFDFESLNLKF